MSLPSSKSLIARACAIAGFTFTAAVGTATAEVLDAKPIAPRRADAALGPSPLSAAPPARPARRATETAAERRSLLRQHTLERAARRVERADSESAYRYMPTPRPEWLRGVAR